VHQAGGLRGGPEDALAPVAPVVVLPDAAGQEASLGGFDVADDPERAKRRLATTLETGELPPRVDLDDFTDLLS
jgi:hypothetical protein